MSPRHPQGSPAPPPQPPRGHPGAAPTGRGAAVALLVVGLLAALLSGFGLTSGGLGIVGAVLSLAAAAVPIYRGARGASGDPSGPAAWSAVAGAVGTAAALMAVGHVVLLAPDPLASIGLAVAAALHVVAAILGARRVPD